MLKNLQKVFLIIVSKCIKVILYRKLKGVLVRRNLYISRRIGK